MTKIDQYTPTTLFFIFPGCGTRSFLHQPQGKYGYGSTMDGGEGSMMFNFQFFSFLPIPSGLNDKHCNKDVTAIKVSSFDISNFLLAK